MYPDPTGPKVGDPVPDFALPDTSGTLCVVRTPEVAGYLATVVFVGDPNTEAAASELAACRELASAFAEAGAKLLVVTSADPAANQAAVQPPATLRVLGDMEGKALVEFGIGKAADRQLPVGFVLDRNSKVLAVVSGGDTPIATRALEEVQRPEQQAGARLASGLAFGRAS